MTTSGVGKIIIDDVPENTTKKDITDYFRGNPISVQLTQGGKRAVVVFDTLDQAKCAIHEYNYGVFRGQIISVWLHPDCRHLVPFLDIRNIPEQDATEQDVFLSYNDYGRVVAIEMDPPNTRVFFINNEALMEVVKVNARAPIIPGTTIMNDPRVAGTSAVVGSSRSTHSSRAPYSYGDSSKYYSRDRNDRGDYSRPKSSSSRYDEYDHRSNDSTKHYDSEKYPPLPSSRYDPYARPNSKPSYHASTSLSKSLSGSVDYEYRRSANSERIRDPASPPQRSRDYEPALFGATSNGLYRGATASTSSSNGSARPHVSGTGLVSISTTSVPPTVHRPSANTLPSAGSLPTSLRPPSSLGQAATGPMLTDLSKHSVPVSEPTIYSSMTTKPGTSAPSISKLNGALTTQAVINSTADSTLQELQHRDTGLTVESETAAKPVDTNDSESTDKQMKVMLAQDVEPLDTRIRDAASLPVSPLAAMPIKQVMDELLDRIEGPEDEDEDYLALAENYYKKTSDIDENQLLITLRDLWKVCPEAEVVDGATGPLIRIKEQIQSIFTEATEELTTYIELNSCISPWLYFSPLIYDILHITTLGEASQVKDFSKPFNSIAPRNGNLVILATNSKTGIVQVDTIKVPRLDDDQYAEVMDMLPQRGEKVFETFERKHLGVIGKMKEPRVMVDPNTLDIVVFSRSCSTLYTISRLVRKANIVGAMDILDVHFGDRIKVLFSRFDNVLAVYDLISAQVSKQIEVTSAVRIAKFSVDRAHILCLACHLEVALVDLNSPEGRLVLTEDTEGLVDILWSPHVKTHLLLVYEKFLKIVDVRDASVTLWTADARSGVKFKSAQFSVDDAAYFLTYAEKGLVELWNWSNTEEIGRDSKRMFVHEGHHRICAVEATFIPSSEDNNQELVASLGYNLVTKAPELHIWRPFLSP